jgi:hypothetical protein
MMLVSDFTKDFGTFAKNQTDPSFPLEEIDMAGNPYGLGYRSDQDDASSIVFDIPEETLEDALGVSAVSSESDPEESRDHDFPMESDDPVDETRRRSSDSDYQSSDGDIPDVVLQLQKELLNGYTLPHCPDEDPQQRILSRAETLSLKHYLAWAESHGTVKAYNSHAKVLAEATEEEILSLYKVKQLAMNLTGLRPSFVEMCPRSCMAFTGKHQSQSTCSYSKNCMESRYKTSHSPRAKPKPRATMLYVPIIPIIQAYYANADTSHQMRHRDNCLKDALNVIAKAAGKHTTVKKSEYANSDNHIHHHEGLGLFKDSTDTALSISSDGAQLTMKKQSNMWLLIVVLLNLPPEICYKTKNVIIPLAIPGPSAPGNVESFIYPLFEELAQASVGMWTWDAIDSSYFVLKAYLCGVKGDMLGSAKLSGMAGHSAVYGDRFSLVQGARPTDAKGSKFQYYPISPPQKERYNPNRDIVNMNDLPLRTQAHYWETIRRLESATTKSEQKNIVTETGISRLTMCAASPAFSHPSFFPLDPFHLFYENCMPHIWDLWVTHTTPEEVTHMSKEMASELGKEIEKAMETLPSSFSGPIRDTHKKRHSQYKIYEWMAILHWYIIPIAGELGFNREVLENFVEFVDLVEIAMSHTPKSAKQLAAAYNLAKSFLEGFQRLYVHNEPEKVSRFRLCIWQLIHVPTHISWNGSIRFGSQATVERAIGEIGHKVRSKKAPFANIATMLFERGNNKVLTLQYPSLAIHPKEGKKKGNLYQSLMIRKAEREGPSEYGYHLATICDYLGIDFDMELELHRWGKCIIPGDVTLRSRISEQRGQAYRSSRYFEAYDNNFGEALAFYFVPEHDCNLVVCHHLEKVEKVLGRWQGMWSKEYRVFETADIIKLVGIWRYKSRVHILRQHAGLDMLNAEEEIEEEEEE